jgi:hypothetical protein
VTLSLDIRLSDLATAVATDIKQLRTWITGSSSGNLSGLTTTDKSNVVAAINEVKAGSSGAPPDASETTKGILELATLTEVATGVDAARAVTAAGVRQERTALKAEILGAGVPAALDTLDELAAALDDDANFAASMTASLAAINTELDNDVVHMDTLMSGVTGEEQANGRTNIAAVGVDEIGNPDVDLVALYVAAKA